MVYGDIIYYSETGQSLMRMRRETPLHIMTRFLCHQALFVKRSSFREKHPFNIKYRVYADYDWLLQAMCISKLKFSYIGIPVVYYQAGGFSQVTLGKYAHERLEIIKRYWGCAVNLGYLIRYPREILYLLGVFLYLIWHLCLFEGKKRVVKP